jgi:hypothetical protein
LRGLREKDLRQFNLDIAFRSAPLAQGRGLQLGHCAEVPAFVQYVVCHNSTLNALTHVEMLSPQIRIAVAGEELSLGFSGTVQTIRGRSGRHPVHDFAKQGYTPLVLHPVARASLSLAIRQEVNQVDSTGESQ